MVQGEKTLTGHVDGEANGFHLYDRSGLVCVDLHGSRNWCWLCAPPKFLRPRPDPSALVTACIPVYSMKANNMLGWVYNSNQSRRKSLKLMFFWSNPQGVVIMGIYYVLDIIITAL